MIWATKTPESRGFCRPDSSRCRPGDIAVALPGGCPSVVPSARRPAGQGRFFPSRYNLAIPLSIKDPETDRLARQLADVTGESLTTAVSTAVRERLERVRGIAGAHDVAAGLTAIALRCAAMPVLDDRPEDEILHYDERGLPV